MKKYVWINTHSTIIEANGLFDSKEQALESAIEFLNSLPEGEISDLDSVSLDNIEDFEILILPVVNND